MPLMTEDFTFDLPDGLIARRPCDDRDGSRLLHLDRSSGRVFHRTFRDLPVLLRQGDRLVMNDTRVLPSRLRCHKSTGASVELLFVERINPRQWVAMAKPGKRMKPGVAVLVDAMPDVALITDDVLDDGNRVISLLDNKMYDSIDSLIAACGEVPLPPYIGREADSSDTERYQTVYARNPGAVAAPTAGLHFTKETFTALENKGISTSFVTLHVGIGTFKPVSEPDPRNHTMHSERYVLPEATASEIRDTKQAGGRIIAVGTTVVRVLESCAGPDGTLRSGHGSTDIFIFPGYKFRVIDAMVTNFHLPRSTLLMLVSAFAGREPVLNAYNEAVRLGYRFFSYGDAMLLI